MLRYPPALKKISKRQNKRLKLKKVFLSHLTSRWQFGEAAEPSQEHRISSTQLLLRDICNQDHVLGRRREKTATTMPGFLLSTLTHTEHWDVCINAGTATLPSSKKEVLQIFFPSSGWHGSKGWIIHLASRKESRESQINDDLSWETPLQTVPNLAMAGVFTVYRGGLKWHQKL